MKREIYTVLKDWKKGKRTIKKGTKVLSNEFDSARLKELKEKGILGGEPKIERAISSTAITKINNSLKTDK